MSVEGDLSLDVAGRLTLAFVLDVANISRADADALDILILTAVVQANQAPVRQDPALLRRYGSSDALLPDSLRRPISHHAIAQSLGLPFETVRRRVRGLAEAGLCRIDGTGVTAPEAVLASEWYAARQAARVARLWRFLQDLSDAGVIRLAPGCGEVLAESIRGSDRVLGDYMLRACDRLLRLTGNAQDGLVLLALWAGAASLGHPLAGAGPGAGARAGPARPGQSGGAVARAIGAPAETVRRRLRALATLGLATQGPAGWRPAWPESRMADGLALRRESLADLRRLLGALESLRGAGAAPAAGGVAPGLEPAAEAAL